MSDDDTDTAYDFLFEPSRGNLIEPWLVPIFLVSCLFLLLYGGC